MRTSSRFYSLVAVLIFVPWLMGALRPLKFELPAIVTPTQQCIIDFAAENGYRIISFTESSSFFAGQFGCRNDETAYLFNAVHRSSGEVVATGLCVQSGTGNLRPAPMRTVAGNYPISNDSDDGSEGERE